ncbi:agamous-like MADS-box protein AGL80 [Solanum dulcamara]|uniref:agamous-like MADS-box protein AGL80 n=1 Tax=Solanum dulcamara TaxID=45834 RepID=UPI002486AC1B|nr:agamous-like MADS-box protein AGL80 [Solanum dulcamara]XP_055826451.1 agamous-like MADS-box protein AGL80 [Solanum dulcamara]
MTRSKVKLAFIENINKRKASYNKRMKGFLKKVHELSILCEVEIVVVIYSTYHQEPKVFPSHDVAINTCTKFREFSYFEQSKNMMTQEKFTRQRIEKMEEQLQKVKKKNRVSELTNKMHELLNGGDIHVGMNFSELNDLSYVINQNLKNIREALKAKDDGEDSTSNAPKSIVGLMESGGTSSVWPRAPRFSSQIFSPIPQMPQQIAPPILPTIMVSPISSPMMAPPTSVPILPEVNPSMNISPIGASAPMDNHQHYSVISPQSPAFSELLDWILDDLSFDNITDQDPNQNNNNM